MCNQLLKLDDDQAANLLLRKCHVPRLNNLARTVHPDLLVPATTIHDSQTRSTFSRLIGYDSLPDNTWQQISLPINMEGFGLTSLASVSHPAFVASWAHAAVELPFRFQSTLPSINSFVNSSDGPIGRVLSECLLDDMFFSNCLSGVGKLQFQLSKRQAQINSENLLSSAATARDAARLRSVQGNSAGAWLSALPTNQEFALSPYDFRLATLLHLEMPIPLSDWSGSCNCGTQLDNSGYHLLTCKTGEGPVWSHDTYHCCYLERLPSRRTCTLQARTKTSSS